MKFPQKHTLKQIATILNCDYVGDDDFPVLGMNEIHVVEAGDIVFVDHPKYYDKALESAATVVLINKEVECPPQKALLISDDPFRDFNTLTNFFKPFEKATSLIAASVVSVAGGIAMQSVLAFIKKTFKKIFTKVLKKEVTNVKEKMDNNKGS